MNNRKAFLILSLRCLILSLLGFLEGFIGGAFKMFVEGMTPGVIAGPSILMLILLKDTDTYGKAFRR